MQPYQFCLLWAIFCFSCGDAQNEAIPVPFLKDVLDIIHGITPTQGLVNPPPVVAKNIKYFLYKSDNPSVPTEISASDIGPLSISDPIYFLLHGWTQNYRTQWYNLTRDALFVHDSSFQVIAVDWEFYANLFYTTAANNTKPVGFLIADFVVALVRQHSVPLPEIVIIGHSLGGQVCGFMGKRIFKILGEKPSRIIALDPGGPLFEGRPPSERLAPTDGTVTHVVHTNGAQFGYLGDCGTIDFRANGGTMQPGCVKEMITNLTHISSTVFCSHHRSWWFFAEGLQASPKFVSKKCDLLLDVLPLRCHGETEEMCSLTTNKTGNFYCNTNPSSPYSK